MKTGSEKSKATEKKAKAPKQKATPAGSQELRKNLEALGNELLSHPINYARIILSQKTGKENEFGNYILSEQRREEITASSNAKDLGKVLKTVQKQDLERFFNGK